MNNYGTVSWRQTEQQSVGGCHTHFLTDTGYSIIRTLVNERSLNMFKQERVSYPQLCDQRWWIIYAPVRNLRSHSDRGPTFVSFHAHPPTAI